MTRPQRGLTWLERVGHRLFRILLRLLPEWFRSKAEPGLTQTFLDRQRDTLKDRGRIGLLRCWIKEMPGLFVTAFRAARLQPDGSPVPSRPFHLAQNMEQLLRDLRFAARNLVRRKRAMTLAVFTFALGIGSSTAMYGVIDSVLLRPLPFNAPDELFAVYLTNPGMAGHPTLGRFASRGTYSWPEIWAIRDGQTSLASFAGYGRRGVTMTGNGAPLRIEIGWSNYELFSMLGVTPLLGRLLNEADEARVEGQSLLLTESFWQERFGGDPAMIGQSIILSDESYTIVGVLPSSAQIGSPAIRAWTAKARGYSEAEWGSHNDMIAVGRLRPGTSVEQAETQMSQVLDSADPNGHGHGIAMYPLLDDQTQGVRPALLALVAGSFVLLLVGCGNVAAILLGAGIDREQELAVRGALGASRGRVVRQLLTESGLIAALGGIGGLLLSGLTLKGLVLLAPPGIPRIEEASIDIRLFLFGFATAVATGVIFGLIPALSLTRGDASPSVGRGTSRPRSKVLSTIVIGELAMATTLLVAGTLLARTLFALNQVDLGFEPDGIVSVNLALPPTLFAGSDSETAGVGAWSYMQEMTDAVAAMPGVTGVARTSVRPLTGDRNNNDVSPEGWVPEGDELLVAERRFVSGNYFDIMGISFVEGRPFDPSEDGLNGADAVILSESLARFAWPNESAIGKDFSFWGREPSIVVGVVRDVRDEQLEEATLFAFYAPAGAFPAQTAGKMLIQTTGNIDERVRDLRAAIQAIDPNVPIISVASLDEYAANMVRDQSYRARLMVVFAIIAVLMAITGIYGVTSRSVARRTREMGIRVALGAQQNEVVVMVVGHGLRLAIVGVGVGLIVAGLSGRWLEGLLYRVSVFDPLSFAGIAGVVLLGAILASLPPSWKAAKTDPLVAFKAE